MTGTEDESYGADSFAAAIEAKVAEARGETEDQPRDDAGRFAAEELPDDEASAAETPAPETEQAPVAAPEADESETPAEPSAEEQADDAGATAAAEEALAALPDDATDEERVDAAREAAAEFYAGRYKTREEADRGIEEKDETLKRLFTERDQQAKRIQELEQQAKAAAEKSDTELDVPAWEQWAETMVEQGAGQAGAWKALEEGGYAGYELYLSTWMRAQTEEGYPDTEQIAAATRTNNEVMFLLAEERAKLAAREAQPAAEPDTKAAAVDARAELVAEYPDFDKYDQKMAQIVNELPPDRAAWLREKALSGPKGVKESLEWVYLRAARDSGETRTRAQQIADERAEAADRAAKVAASVSTPEASAARTPHRSEAEQRALDYKNARVRAMGLPVEDE